MKGHMKRTSYYLRILYALILKHKFNVKEIEKMSDDSGFKVHLVSTNNMQSSYVVYLFSEW
jgi:hypothetical protein